MNYEIVRTAHYLGTEYKIVQILEGDLLLVVPIEEIENGKFPLQVCIIPDTEMIEKRNNMRL